MSKIISPPRDAGFFSVFNYFMGLLSTDAIVYPFWNAQYMKIINRISHLQHFCYLNPNIENSWFEYFQPIAYHDDDHTHTEITTSIAQRMPFSQRTLYEFEIPRKEHFLRSDIQEWRERVHTYFTKYIKFSDAVNQKVHEFVSNNFPTDGTPVIAVHYRHPSHSCEEGFVPISRYFNKIDELLSQHPNARIFLATDTHFGVIAFKAEYGERLFYNTSITRTSLDNLLEWAYARGTGITDGVGFINNKGYELQHVSCALNMTDCKIGYDVLVDTICLSKCDWFVHTLSNLSLAVSYMNPKTEMILA